MWYNSLVQFFILLLSSLDHLVNWGSWAETLAYHGNNSSYFYWIFWSTHFLVWIFFIFWMIFNFLGMKLPTMSFIWLSTNPLLSWITFSHMNVSMVVHLLMLAYAFSTAFDLYIFHHTNRLSFLFMLLNVVFLRYSDDQNGFLCYDPQAQRTCLFLNVVFVEHNP